MVRATMIRAVALAVVALVMAAADSGPAQAQVRDTWDQVKNYTIEKKNAAVDVGKALVRDSDAKIKELEEKAAGATGEAKAAYERSLKELKTKRAEAEKKLGDMDTSTDNAWDATKKGFADAYEDLQQSYRSAVEYFKK